MVAAADDQTQPDSNLFYRQTSLFHYVTYIFILFHLYSQTVFIAMPPIVKQSTVIWFIKKNGML